MADFETLGPVAQRAQELFPNFIVTTTKVQFPSGDASYVAMSTLHDPAVVTATMVDNYGDLMTGPLVTRGNMRFECFASFHTVSEVEQYRSNICLLSERDEACFNLVVSDQFTVDAHLEDNSDE